MLLTLNHEIDLDNVIQTKKPDCRRLAHAFNTAKGAERTYEQFAKEIGISKAKCSRIKTGDFTRPLELEVIKRISSGTSPCFRMKRAWQ